MEFQKKWTFLELAKKILEEEKKPLTPEEIWEMAKTKGYDKYVGTQGKTPWATIGAQIYVNIRDNKKSPFIKIDSSPTRFYLRTLFKKGEELEFIEEQPITVLKQKRFEYSEEDLHPFLAFYANTFLKTYTKTIQHTKSKRGDFGEWIHPDMVGCYFLSVDWKSEVVDFRKSIGDVTIKLFSFEIKRLLEFSNLRESFFQMVSNSSWANEGYLVSSEISNDVDFLNELERLSTSFGIGIIKIDIEDPNSSDVLFPAKFKEYLDWDAINKLASLNPDFKEFLKRVKNDISSNEIINEKYDKIYSEEELIKSVKK